MSASYPCKPQPSEPLDAFAYNRAKAEGYELALRHVAEGRVRPSIISESPLPEEREQ